MADITESGLYLDILGQPYLVTQGLVGYTLVDESNMVSVDEVKHFLRVNTSLAICMECHDKIPCPDK